MYQRLLYVKLPIIIDYNNQNIIKNLQINKVTSSMPSISVIIPSYNYESYMYEAIKSVLLQSLKDFELIIVDDGSTDDSMAVARSFAGQRSTNHCATTSGWKKSWLGGNSAAWSC